MIKTLIMCDGETLFAFHHCFTVSWAYLNEFLIQPSGRGSKCTLESANFSGCIVNVCVSVLIYSF